MAKREKKVIISGVTRESADEAFAIYAKADAQSMKIIADIELQCAKIRERYANKLAELEGEKEKAFNAQWLGFGEDGDAGIALFLGAVPVLVVARKIKVGLVRLHLGFAQAEDVGVLGLKKIKKALARTGAQAVYIPGN